MKRKAILAYRRWQMLNHEGLNDDTFVGLNKFHRAKSIWLLVAAAPWLPLMISDMAKVERGWLWHGWSVIAIGWSIGISSLMIASVIRSVRVYIRSWRANRNQ